MLEHDPKVGIDFLRWLHPSGPWTLVAINRDEHYISCRTFRPGGERQLVEWLKSDRHEACNIYYHVNPPALDVSKKAEREEILEMRFLHVDADPRAGESIDSERERILHALTDRLPQGLPPPSCIVYSGGGYNALWRLAEPVAIQRESASREDALARAEDAKRYNLQLEILLGGDNCHNVDRILRLPGTINRLDAKKRSKGRVQEIAKIVRMDESVYPIATFIPAAHVQRAGAGGGAAVGGGGVQVRVSGNVQRLQHVDELGDKVDPKTKMIIVQGVDPDDPNKFGTSRSEWLFHVCCALVRANISDDTIYATITDPDFLISASILDKGSRAEEYALRQIKRAREDAIDPNLRLLNERHAVIGNIAGKCRIIEEVIDYSFGEKVGRPRLTVQSFDDFSNRYVNQRVVAGKNKDGENVYQPLGKWWIHHKDRRQYDSIVFSPAREVPNAYNLWRGFACEAKAGSGHESFLTHLRDVICDGIKLYYEYLVGWMARAVQKPDEQGEVAVVFRGDQGVGKSTVPREFGKLWGRHYLAISNSKHLVGSFNAHLRDAILVFADEAFYAGDKTHESILKTLVTEDSLIVEGKGRDAETSRNYVHLMMASNSTWVVPAGPNERRYFILDVKPHRMRQFNYFERIRQDLDDGGRENLLHFLLTYDVSKFNHREVPQTDALREQKMHSFSAEQEWWYQKLVDGALMRYHHHWESPCFKNDLQDEYLLHMQKQGHSRRASATSLGRFLHTVTPDGWPRTKQLARQVEDKHGHPVTTREYAYMFPPLRECRAWWDSKFSGPYPWPEDEEVTTTPNEPF